MEYVDGITLQELVEDYGRLPPERVIHLMLQICGSLSEAHQLGMIHRDIKPSNVIVTARSGMYDMVKVLDFGLVKQIDGQLESTSLESTSLDLTQSDGIIGTPMYMSPEAVRDAAASNERSDLYSLGAVGYMMLAGAAAPSTENRRSMSVGNSSTRSRCVRANELNRSYRTICRTC